ncbi:hypothetical protein SLS54_005963 [Diplodia seriata]
MGAYEIRVWDRYESFDYEVINGCNGGFFTGHPVCMQCPSDFLELCNAVENVIMLVGNQGMVMGTDSRTINKVSVPGSQRFYINPLGAVAYTQAHSAYIPADSIVG